MARTNFILGGLDLEVGSVQEELAMRAFRHKQYTRFLETRTIVEAITFVGGLVVAAINKSGSAPKLDPLNDLLGELRSQLMPDLAEEKDSKAKKVKKIIEEEINRGPFKVESMGTTSKGKKRKR